MDPRKILLAFLIIMVASTLASEEDTAKKTKKKRKASPVTVHNLDFSNPQKIAKMMASRDAKGRPKIQTSMTKEKSYTGPPLDTPPEWVVNVDRYRTHVPNDPSKDPGYVVVQYQAEGSIDTSYGFLEAILKHKTEQHEELGLFLRVLHGVHWLHNSYLRGIQKDCDFARLEQENGKDIIAVTEIEEVNALPEKVKDSRTIVTFYSPESEPRLEIFCRCVDMFVTKLACLMWQGWESTDEMLTVLREFAEDHLKDEFDTNAKDVQNTQFQSEIRNAKNYITMLETQWSSWFGNIEFTADKLKDLIKLWEYCMEYDQIHKDTCYFYFVYSLRRYLDETSNESRLRECPKAMSSPANPSEEVNKWCHIDTFVHLAASPIAKARMAIFQIAKTRMGDQQ